MKTAIMMLAFLPTIGSAALNAIFYFSTGQVWYVGLAIAAAVIGCDIVKPLCFATKASHWSLTAVLVVCGLFLAALSMNASINLTYSAINTGENVAESAASRIVEIEAELPKLPVLPVSQTQVDEAQAAADREAGRGGCGRKCEKLKVTAADLLAAKAGYDRRTALEAERKTLRDAASKADGTNDTDGALRTSRMVGIGVELVSILAVVFGTMALAKIEAAPKQKPRPVQPAASPKKWKRVTPAMVREAIEAKKGRGKSVAATAKKLGCNPRTLQHNVDLAERNGPVKLVVSNR